MNLGRLDDLSKYGVSVRRLCIWNTSSPASYVIVVVFFSTLVLITFSILKPPIFADGVVHGF